MRTTIRFLLFVLLSPFAIADPPDEDVHRPILPAKDGLYAQFDLGLNYSFLDGNPVIRAPLQGDGATDFYNSATGLAPLISATIGYRFTPLFALSFRADYDARYVGRSGRLRDSMALFDNFGLPIGQSVEDVDKEYSLGVDYLSFSILGNFMVDQLFVFLGPTISVPLGRDYQETNTIVDQASPYYYFPNTPSETKRITGREGSRLSDNVKQRISFKFGVGYAIPLTEKIALVPQLAYDMGLTNLLGEEEIYALHGTTGSSFRPAVLNPDMMLSSLQATIGIRINL